MVPAVSVAPSTQPESHTPRALVVENDLTSRELLARVLRSRGLDAHTAIGAAQAAALLLEAPVPYDLLIVDLDLQPVDGIDLLRHVPLLPPPRRPRRIIAISQSLAPHYPRLAELQLDLDTLQKPVHLPSLMKIVEGLSKAEG
jgi:CheY-like chemotaxis protein